MHNMSYQSPIPPAGAAASRRRPACRYLCLLSIMWNTATISPGMRRSHLSHGRAHVSAAPNANGGKTRRFEGVWKSFKALREHKRARISVLFLAASFCSLGGSSEDKTIT